MMSAARGGNFNSFVPLVGEGVSVLSNFAAYSAVQASMQEGPLCTGDDMYSRALLRQFLPYQLIDFI